ncbi:MAG: cytochrome c3 family protein [Bryobacterales bacterium]|nr:cytochrome c3 family protein [Bryobacterales bacterium]
MLLFVSGVTLAAPFSHKLHTKLVPKCESCHASITASTKASDNNLPQADACAACHEQRTISSPRTTTVTIFNHQKHIALGNIAPVILRRDPRQELSRLADRWHTARRR